MSVETWPDILRTLGDLGLAYLLGLPVGWERERRARSPGLRTFPLVALGACAYVLIGERAFPDNSDAQARVIQALLTGVGFIAGGSILKGRETVWGLATAASVWVTAAIGAAVAHGQVVLAVALSLITLLTMHRFRPPWENEGSGAKPPATPRDPRSVEDEQDSSR